MDVQLTNQVLSHFTGKRILITGASGYLATNLIHSLQDIDCTVVRLSRDIQRLLPVNGKARIVDIPGDIHLKQSWELALKDVHLVYHLAAQTSVYVAEDTPLMDLEINVVPMLHLLETCRQQGKKPIIVFSGTVTEAGIPEKLPVDETHRDNPVTIYDMHKLMAENYLKHYAQQGVVRGTTLRLSNVYGPGPKSSSADRGVINMMIRKAMAGDALTVYGKGDYLRDYIYVNDVISALMAVPLHIEQVNGNHYVLGSGKGWTIVEAMNLIAERVALKTGKQVFVEHIDPPFPQSPIESRNFIADSSTFTEATGWQASYDLQDGIDQTIQYF